MPYINREKFNQWRINILAAIDYLNSLSKSDLTGENVFALEYRGKNHKIVLTHDGNVVARGIIAIERNIGFLIAYYKGEK